MSEPCRPDPTPIRKKRFKGFCFASCSSSFPHFTRSVFFPSKNLFYRQKFFAFFVREERERSFTLNLPLHFSIVCDPSPPFRVMKTRRERKTRRVIKKKARVPHSRKRKARSSRASKSSAQSFAGRARAQPRLSFRILIRVVFLKLIQEASKASTGINAAFERYEVLQWRRRTGDGSCR